MKLWIVRDTCYECNGQPVAVFDNEEDADSLCNAFTGLSWEEVETEELLTYKHDRYESWFNDRADRALRERATRDCD